LAIVRLLGVPRQRPPVFLPIAIYFPSISIERARAPEQTPLRTDAPVRTTRVEPIINAMPNIRLIGRQ
jgi:hypothetical protein